MQYINDNDILYFEGEHIVNIAKRPYLSQKISSKNETFKLFDPDYFGGYSPYCGTGFELTTPYGYRLVNAFYTYDSYIVYTFVNEVPVIVENGKNNSENLIGTPYLDTNMKLTKYKK